MWNNTTLLMQALNCLQQEMNLGVGAAVAGVGVLGGLVCLQVVSIIKQNFNTWGRGWLESLHTHQDSYI
nr:SAT protein [Porcine parvovirus 1]UTN00507.1 SAT protein [Porcine parvovirus 1]UTN00633.1 SAT protein [Porcine parvovirus 1]UTN00636.1 SAT protein [Porcine parvovirus 1]UTN00639.1 SAT protein [Porcine parvovirus 1]